MLQQMREKELSDVVERPKNRERTGCSAMQSAETKEQREERFSRLERRSTSDVMSERLKNRERLGQREGA